MKKIFSFIISLIFGLTAVCVPPISAIEIHVNPGKSIQAAIDFASNGDMVIVQPGSYVENINFSGKAITVKSIDPNNHYVRITTDIYGNQTGSVITFNSGEEENSILSGFTLQNGFANNGGGIQCQNASPTISKCSIINSSAFCGGGIYCSNSSPNINNCAIVGNVAKTSNERGGGIYCGDRSSPIIINCVIRKNSSFRYGGGIYCGFSSHPRIINCTIIENSASQAGGGIYCQSNCYPKIINSILWDDFPQEIYVTEDGGNPTVVYSNIFANYPGEGNIFTNPLLINTAAGDCHLLVNSPCIDAGTNTDAPSKDKDGILRPQDGNNDDVAICDIGAYEFVYFEQPVEPDQNQPVNQNQQQPPPGSNGSSGGICFLSAIQY